MKQFNKTFLPDKIEYNNKTYLKDIGKSHSLQDNTYFDTKGCIQVNVLSPNLKGKTDLHGQPYKPTKWVYSTEPLYKVCRVYRKSGRKKVIEKNLTEAEAKRLVNSFPDSQTMVVFYKQ